MSYSPSLFSYKNGKQLSSYMGYADPMQAADTDAAGGFVYLDIDITRTTSFTATSKWIGAGGIITAGANNITGNFWAPPSVQMFNAADTNTVTLPQSSEIYVAWYGAKGDNTTDDSNAWNQALKTVVNCKGGATLKASPNGQYKFTSQVSGTVLNSELNSFPFGAQYVIDGMGCTISPSGSISGMDLKSGSAFSGWMLRNTQFYLHNNASAPAALRLYGAVNSIVDRCNFLYGLNSANFAAVSIQSMDPSNNDSGSFWTTIQNCVLRVQQGGDGFSPTGILVYGTANSLRILNNRITGVTNGILITKDPSVGATTAIPNAVMIAFNAFETIETNCISVVGSVGGFTVAGLTVIGNRFEHIENASAVKGNLVSLTGATFWQNNITPFIGFNENISFGATICNNPNAIPVTIIDSSANKGYNENLQGFTFTSQDPSKDVLTVTPSNANSGLALTNPVGTVLATLRQTSGSQTTLAGSGLVLGLSLINGISGTTTIAQNLRGTVTFAGAGTATVTFPVAETNNTYFVAISGSANETFWVTSKTANGFTVNSSNAASTAVVNWILVR
jgi:hypothetical protein